MTTDDLFPFLAKSEINTTDETLDIGPPDVLLDDEGRNPEVPNEKYEHLILLRNEYYRSNV